MLYNLKNTRISQGLTLKELSKKTGISTTYLNDLENLNCYNLSYRKMEKLVKVLKTSVGELEKQKDQ